MTATTIPAVLEEFLANHALPYTAAQIRTDIELPTNKVLTTLLGDQQGKVQILYPAHALLDLQAIEQLTGRALRPLSPSAVETLCSSKGLAHLPAVPNLLGVETWVDQQLLKMADLQLDLGDHLTVLQLSSNDFNTLLDGAQSAALSIPFTELSHGNLDSADDVEEITRSLANFTQIRIKKRLEDTLEIPPLPATAQRIIRLRANPYADIKDLSDIVESDPPLSAQVVSWASSPYYAAPGKISSIHDAIVRVLGFDLVMNLALGLALGKTLTLPKESAQGFTPYWQQAVFGATAMEQLVKAMPADKRPDLGIAYLSGLLHNFGYLVLADVFPPHFSMFCQYQEANRTANHTLIERHLLGISRDQIGSWLMRLWEMPDEVYTAIRHHNTPNYTGDHEVCVQLLHVATRLLRQHGIGDAPLEPIAPEIFENLGIDAAKADRVIQHVLASEEQLQLIARNIAT